MYQRFRFTPRTTRKVLAWGLVTPVLMYALAKYSDVSLWLRILRLSQRHAKGFLLLGR